MIEVREGRLGKEVRALRQAAPGQVLLQGWGERVSHRTRHSIQVDFCDHVIIDSPIQFLNHSCDPNCGVLLRRGKNSLEIHALRAIEPGEELTIDYATFEFEIHFMTSACQCGSPQCRVNITGYKDLPEERREAYGKYVADFLHDLEPAAYKAG